MTRVLAKAIRALANLDVHPAGTAAVMYVDSPRAPHSQLDGPRRYRCVLGDDFESCHVVETGEACPGWRYHGRCWHLTAASELHGALEAERAAVHASKRLAAAA